MSKSKIPSKLIYSSLLKSPFFWAICIRVLLLVLLNLRIAGDAGDYLALARNIAEGRGFTRCGVEPFPPTAQRPPLYPYLLSVLVFLGLEGAKWAAALNVILDLGSMVFLQAIGRELKFKSAQWLPWIIAVFPPVVFMSLYPLTESLGTLLFLGAMLLFLRARWSYSGFVWGCLALCRSYMALFPVMIGFFYWRQQRITAKGVVTLILWASVMPIVWLIRNYATLGLLTFSQTAGASVQSFIGLCMDRFDWWNAEQVSQVFGISEYKTVLQGHCLQDSELIELGAKGWEHVTLCIQRDPWGTAQNVMMKGIDGFFKWGRALIYEDIPPFIMQSVYVVMILLWGWMIVLMSTHRHRTQEWKKGFFLFIAVQIYLLGVTLPFALDARYFLPSTILALMLAAEAAVSRKAP